MWSSPWVSSWNIFSQFKVHLRMEYLTLLLYPFVWLPSQCSLKHTSKYFSEAAGKYELRARELVLVVLKPSLSQMLRNLSSMRRKYKHLSVHSFSEVPALVVTTWQGWDLQACVSKKLSDLLWLPLSLPSPIPSELLPGEVNTASYSLQKHFQKSAWRSTSAGSEDSCCSISSSLTQGWECSTTNREVGVFLLLLLYSKSSLR